MSVSTALKIVLVFVNGFAGVVASYPGQELSPLPRLLAGAVVVGCGAVLLMLQPPGRAAADDDRPKPRRG